METTFIDYEVEERIATITLNRPEAANAQTLPMLDDLDEAWRRAAADDDVRVIILQANGKHFSAGHDLKGVGNGNGNGEAPPTWTLAEIYGIEARSFLEYTLRWRNVPKPSIAAVQGVCIAGGLLLAWPCDLIIAADNAKFSDPVVSMGIGGVEYHGHTWEWGARKAKELLFTGRAMTAEEAERIGMVTKVVPLEDLARRDAGPGGGDREEAPVRPAPGQAGGEPDPRRAGLLRGGPIGLRDPPDRTRPRAQRIGPPHSHALGRVEGEGGQALRLRSPILTWAVGPRPGRVLRGPVRWSCPRCGPAGPGTASCGLPGRSGAVIR